MEREDPMNHTEAIEQLAAERYLLDELAPHAREAFEEHFFDCQECALDMRAGALLVHTTKSEFPPIPSPVAVPDRALKPRSASWLFWLRPAFAMPAFAALLAIVVFQNTVTFPALREATTQPRLLALNHLRPATRGADLPTISADRVHGAALQVDLSNETAVHSYSVDLLDAQEKRVWSTTMRSGSQGPKQDEQFSLYLPGAKLQNGPYLLKITGVDAQGHNTPIEEYRFDIVVSGR